MKYESHQRLVTAVLIAVVSALTMTPSNAQFKVLAVRGSVSAKGSATLKIGQQLTTKDQLKLGRDGYISMAHKSGKAVELSKSGTYKLKDLDAVASKKGKSSTSKFASYVADQLTETDDPIEFSDNRRTKMRTTGSVERAAGDEVNLWDSVLTVVGAPGEMAALSGKQQQAVKNGDILAVVTPTHTRILGDSIAFIWHASPKVRTYKAVIVGRDNKVVSTLESPDTVVVASVANLNLQPGQVYYWHLEDAASSALRSDQYALYVLQGGERRSAEQLVADVRSEYDVDHEAIGNLILASAFEEMGLYQNAHMAYRDAIEIAPDVESYRRMYADFLKRQGLSMDAYAAYHRGG